MSSIHRSILLLTSFAVLACGTEQVKQSKNLPPKAAIIGGDRTASVGEAVTFDGRGSTDPEGELESLSWDFGDAAKSKEALATHTYSAPGDLTVTLTATDKSGQTDVASVKVTVTGKAGNKPPLPVLTGPVQISVGKSGDYDASASTDPDGKVQSFTWSFGDGATATGAKASHAWATQGTYNLAVVVTDDGGATATAKLSVMVLPGGNQPPRADPGTDRTAAPGQAVQFDGSASKDPDGTITSYLWDFGDGTTAPTAKAAKTFNVVNKFTVKLTVTDNEGATGTASVVVDVKGADYSGTYTVVANPKTATCMSSGDAKWVDTQLKITVNGSAISAEETGAPVVVKYSGNLAGAAFTMTGKYQTVDSGVTVDHENKYEGTFQSATTFTGKLTEAISTLGMKLCDVTWNVTGAR